MRNTIKRLLYVRLDVIDMFNPNTDTNEIFGDTGSELFLLTELLMSRNRRCNNQLHISKYNCFEGYSFCISNVGKMTDHLEIVDESRGGVCTTLDAKRQD